MRRQLGKFASRIRFRLQYFNHQGKTPLRQIAKALPSFSRPSSQRPCQPTPSSTDGRLLHPVEDQDMSSRLQSCSPTQALPPVRNHGSAHNWSNTLNAGGVLGCSQRRDAPRSSTRTIRMLSCWSDAKGRSIGLSELAGRLPHRNSVSPTSFDKRLSLSQRAGWRQHRSIVRRYRGALVPPRFLRRSSRAPPPIESIAAGRKIED
jgi:hypothetical protein